MNIIDCIAVVQLFSPRHSFIRSKRHLNDSLSSAQWALSLKIGVIKTRLISTILLENSAICIPHFCTNLNEKNSGYNLNSNGHNI